MLEREQLVRWVWLCPLLSLLLAAAVLLTFGVSFWTALLAALFLVCPALIVWGAWQAWRGRNPS